MHHFLVPQDIIMTTVQLHCIALCVHKDLHAMLVTVIPNLAVRVITHIVVQQLVLDAH
jgi:hypothetical protein